MVRIVLPILRITPVVICFMDIAVAGTVGTRGESPAKLDNQSAPVPSAGILADYDAELRQPDGRVDIDAMTPRLEQLGVKRVRRLLTEAAWHHRHAYVVSKGLKKRWEGQPQWAVDIADRAGVRLRRRYRRLVNKGKLPCKATTAVARELAGFIWSALVEYEARKKKRKAA